MNDDAISVTMLVIDVLDALDVPYVIGGSLASAMHGVARTTLDSDLVADLKMEHVAPLSSNFMISFMFLPMPLLMRSSIAAVST